MKIVKNDITPQSIIFCDQCEKMVIFAIETAAGERICKECAEAALADFSKVTSQSAVLQETI